MKTILKSSPQGVAAKSLRDYALPKIGKRKVDELAPVDFAEACSAIWC